MMARAGVALSLVLAAVAATGCKPSRAQTDDGRPGDHAGHAAPPPPPASAAHGAHGGQAPSQASAVPEGYAAISVEPAIASAIGLTTAPVEERDFVRHLRTTGIIVVDETRTARVHTKVRGWVDGIRVDYVGQRVAAGQILCRIYSQEVYAAEIEYLALLDRTRLEPLPRGEFADQEKRAREELITAARRRLGLWDVPKSEIARLESSREAQRTFPLLAPRSGVVVNKQVLDGMYVDPSVDLYTVSDLSRLWLLADVYESDVAAVHLGQVGRLEIQGLAEPVDAKVAFLPPTIDEPTRTLKVRFELANKESKLRPGAFATVTMDLALGHGLAVPENAVIRTGPRAIVFVVHDKHIMPREITLGPLVDDLYRVDAGLAAGDIVATGAQFLLDSETRLRANSGSGAGHGGH